MRALIIGSAMIDIITLVAAENIERMKLHNDGKSFLLLEQGRKVAAQGITSHVGGGGCNVAVSLARRDWHAEVLACIGDDLNGQAVKQHLENNNISTSCILSIPEQATGVAVMIAAHERNATIFVHRGANEHLKESSFDVSAFKNKDLVYVSALSNDSANAFPYIVQQARQAGAFVATNPGIRQLTGKTDTFFKTLQNIDLLSLNRVEAEALVPGLHTYAKNTDNKVPVLKAQKDDAPLLRQGLHFGGFDLGLSAFAQAIHSFGVRWLLVTDGLDGAYLFHIDKTQQQSAWWCPSIKSVEVKGTAGAGDAFCSTLASLLVSKEIPPQTALVHAALNAAAVISEVNTTDGLLSYNALAERAKTTDIKAQSLL